MRYQDINVRAVVEQEDWNFVRAEARLKAIMAPIKDKIGFRAMMILVGMTIGCALIGAIVALVVSGSVFGYVIAGAPIGFFGSIPIIIVYGNVIVARGEYYVKRQLQSLALEKPLHSRR